VVEKVVMSMQSSADPTPLLGGDAPLDHVVSQPIQPVVDEVIMPMQSSADPTLLLESVKSTKVVMSMQSSVDHTLLLESVESTKVVMLMQSLADPTLLLGSDMSTDYVFIISSSVLSEQGGISFTLSTPPPSPRMVSFDWNDLVETHLPSSTNFQISVEVNSKNIYRCIVDEGASASILSSSAWKSLDSPKLLFASHELLDFDRRTSEYLGILP
jgi:hypothetical protein